MALIFHERVGSGWAAYQPVLLAHSLCAGAQGARPECSPTRFADVDRIRDAAAANISCRSSKMTGRWCTIAGRSPVIWRIAFPTGRPCSAVPAGRGAARLVEYLVRHHAGPVDAAADLCRLHLVHRSGRSRRTSVHRARHNLGMTLEAYSAEPRRGAAGFAGGLHAAGTHAVGTALSGRPVRRPMSITSCSRCFSGRASAARATCWRGAAWTPVVARLARAHGWAARRAGRSVRALSLGTQRPGRPRNDSR